MVGSIELIALFVIATPTVPPAVGYCIDCHAKREEPRLRAPTSSIAKSAHALLEEGCVACHGGDVREPTARAHDPKLGFRGKPGPKDVPRVCGGCHSDAAYMRRFSATLSIDQLALYRHSQHGLLLEKGRTDVATCISCHGAHDVARVSSPTSRVHATRVADTCGGCHTDPSLFASAARAENPVRGWKKSVHAKALLEEGDGSAPTCNDCHGDHGAAPPAVRDEHNVCGRCHIEQSERFQKSAHAEPFGRLGFGECDECHGRHEIEIATDDMLLARGRAVCVRCHAKDDDKGAIIARALYEKIDGAESRAREARKVVEGLTGIGLLLPDAEVHERELHTALATLRIAVHDAREDALTEALAKVDEASGEMVRIARATEADLALRRRGYVFFIGLAAAMAILLRLKLARLAK